MKTAPGSGGTLTRSLTRSTSINAKEGLMPHSTCRVPGCVRTDIHAAALCAMHYQRWQKAGRPGDVAQIAQRRSTRLTGHQLSYKAMHQRLRFTKGPAKQFRCIQCDRQAEVWAYQHTDPNEMFAEQGPYSERSECYKPMCRPCHRRMDFEDGARRRAEAGAVSTKEVARMLDVDRNAVLPILLEAGITPIRDIKKRLEWPLGRVVEMIEQEREEGA